MSSSPCIREQDAGPSSPKPPPGIIGNADTDEDIPNDDRHVAHNDKMHLLPNQPDDRQLCNKCGLFERAHSKPRPKKLLRKRDSPGVQSRPTDPTPFSQSSQPSTARRSVPFEAHNQPSDHD
ncbi:hypothetical protein EYR38_002010 [Pleurotus pulmonarius]|nr:hypothetical protein EYR38_002010 [Pleurotus pulmonarius]